MEGLEAEVANGLWGILYQAFVAVVLLVESHAYGGQLPMFPHMLSRSRISRHAWSFDSADILIEPQWLIPP